MLYDSSQMHCLLLMLIQKDEILEEFPKLLRENDTRRLQQCYELMNRAPNGLTPMLEKLEEFIWHAGIAELRASADVLVKVSNAGHSSLFKS